LGREVRGGRVEGRRPQAHDRGGRAPQRRRSLDRPEVAGPHQVRADHPGAGRHHDPEFEAWANKVWNFGSGLGAEVSLQDFRKDLMIELYNEAGQLVITYKVYRAWVSEYQALPDLDANANAVAIQTLKLEHEGWERDVDVVEPSEPQFAEP
jgi:T4-like virus tail tube protein gp19